MELLIVYAKIKNELKLIGVHSNLFYLESRYDFNPRLRATNMLSMDAYQQYVENSLYTDSSTFKIEIKTDLDEASFINMFSEKIKHTLVMYGDEKVIIALSMERGGY